MDLADFCREHGIILDRFPKVGVWTRYRTVDHPNKRNGAVKYLGTHAFVQNHAVDLKVCVWRADGRVVDELKIRRMVEDAERKKLEGQARAAKRAQEIMSSCTVTSHPYLERKGFPDDFGLTCRMDGKWLLVVPMRVNDTLVGCQLIDEDGGKKFLFGQRTSGAAHVIDSRGPSILCEGYATGLSIQAAMKKLNRPYRIFVCFSANNLSKLASIVPRGLIVADNDTTGLKVAQGTGWPYWVSDVPGEDANDAHKRLGLFRFSQSLLRAGQSLNRA